MRMRLLLGGALALLVLGTAPARAQTTVDAGVEVHSGPVSGHVEVASPGAVRREPVREVIVVERVHVPRGRAHGWWKKQGYRAVTVYRDADGFYARRVARRNLVTVVVYERQGRYYQWVDDDDGGEHGHGGHGHGTH
ncbi:MAG TPA: hypothetical protein VFK09_03425 [Gemmatimonadales bacterium]|nr:hypothetical protein [Gemmatimonadales bacterium]